MTTKFRIHYKDNYGQTYVEYYSWKEYLEALERIKNDPYCEDIWAEFYDDEEGWQS